MMTDWHQMIQCFINLKTLRKENGIGRVNKREDRKEHEERELGGLIEDIALMLGQAKEN